MEYTKQFIGGSWVDAVSGEISALTDPATEREIASMAYGNGDDAIAAIEAASASYPEWREVGPYARADVLHRAADLIEDRADDLATVTSRESGKPITQSRAEWLSAPTYLRYAAEEAKRIGGRIIPARLPGRRIDVTYAPLGVVGVIAAWNFPIYNVNRATSSALAAGCTVVIRPSERTPQSALAYAAALADAGAPAGVVNVINGESGPMGQAMLDDPRVRKIQFTGSSTVGRLLMDGASRTVTRLSLELGGNAPVIVMPDVDDIAKVAAGAVTAKYRNAGQVCIAPQRFIIHESVADEFTETVASLSDALSVGNPLDESTDIGPIITASQLERIERIVTESADAGATVRTGGRRVGDTGYFFAPTVLAGDVLDTPAMTEEVFGPLMPVTPFSSIDEAVSIANRVEFGLTSFLWTTDLETAYTVSERLEFGMVGVNDWYTVTAEAPFGGVKQAGLGRESGTEGVLEYLEPKTRYFGDVS